MEPAQESKKGLRRRLRAARAALSPTELAVAADALAALVLALPEVRAARTVAAYVSVGAEPGTGPLLAAMREAGARVLLPVVLPDLDLDWADSDGALLQESPYGLLEPVGPRLGREGIAAADVVLAPALAVGADGTRLGQGGGCYDRALPRLRPGTPVVALLHEGEVLASVPAAAHDRRVDAAVTPTGLVRFR